MKSIIDYLHYNIYDEYVSIGDFEVNPRHSRTKWVFGTVGRAARLDMLNLHPVTIRDLFAHCAFEAAYEKIDCIVDGVFGCDFMLHPDRKRCKKRHPNISRRLFERIYEMSEPGSSRLISNIIRRNEETVRTQTIRAIIKCRTCPQMCRAIDGLRDSFSAMGREHVSAMHERVFLRKFKKITG